jgi:C-terminal processing protease CtpA/Prc
MNGWKRNIVGCILMVMCLPAMAQQATVAPEVEMRAAEDRLSAEERRELERAKEMLAEEAREIERLSRAESEDVARRMREAERRMAEAARQVADLSMRQLPHVERIERIVRTSRGPVLGVTIGSRAEDGPVDGVEIFGVSPGGAAAEAGLRAGDVLTSINGESLAADRAGVATDRLLDFMAGVEMGDRLDVEYLRNGKRSSVEVAPHPIENHTFAFQFDDGNFSGPNVAVRAAPAPQVFSNYVWAMQDDGFGDMEMVKLTERLGSYFGTDEGLLVVRAPSNEVLKLEDGDVILGIDGRTPNSVSHAMRILGSYQAGETLKIEIMRDKRKRTIEIEMPVELQSQTAPPLAPVPAVAPRAVIIEREERT